VPTTKPFHAAYLFLIISSVLCLGVVLAALTGWPPMGIPGEWVWQPLLEPALRFPSPLELLSLAVFVALFLGVIYWLASLAESEVKSAASKAHKLTRTLAAAALVVSSFLLQLGIRDIGPSSAAEDVLVVAIPSAGGYAKQARVVEVMGTRSFLANYHLFIARFRDVLADRLHVGHINTHPPGNILFFRGVTRLLEGSPGLQEVGQKLLPPASEVAFELVEYTWSVPFWFNRALPGLETTPVILPADPGSGELQVYRAMDEILTGLLSQSEATGLWLGALGLRLAGALTVLMTYVLGCTLFGRRQAVWAAALVGTCPALLLFSPSFDVLYACLGALAFWLVYTAVRDKTLIKAFLAGLVTYVGLFFSLAIMVSAGLAVAVCLVGWLQHRELTTQLTNKRLWVAALVAVVGFLAPALALRLLTGYRSFAVWGVCYRMNALFNQESGRTFWKWVLYNPLDFFIFLGVPAATLCIWGLAGGIKSLRRWQKLKQASSLSLVLLACIVALDFSGKNLGEAGRLWLFLMPLAALSCAGMLGRFGCPARKVALSAAALQMFQVAAFRICLNLMLMI